MMSMTCVASCVVTALRSTYGRGAVIVCSVNSVINCVVEEGMWRGTAVTGSS